jgi:hypothetical protein
MWWTGQCRCHLHQDVQHSTELMHDPLMWSICLSRNCKKQIQQWVQADTSPSVYKVNASLLTYLRHDCTPQVALNKLHSWTFFLPSSVLCTINLSSSNNCSISWNKHMLCLLSESQPCLKFCIQLSCSAWNQAENHNWNGTSKEWHVETCETHKARNDQVISH